ncbi:hypothetical protein WUBG_12605, partial [Wuchereria bancrofti]
LFGKIGFCLLRKEMLIVELLAEEKMKKRRNDSLVADTMNSQRFFASNMELLKA